MEVVGRERIVRAALACVLDQGWNTTSMQQVRRRAGVSNGSMFHHFPTREALTDAVVAEGLAGHQTALWAAMRDAGSAMAGVHATVVRHLEWVADHRELARLLLTTPPDVLRAEIAPEAVAENRQFFGRVSDWLTEHGWTGRPALPVVLALWMGPAQEYARRWLSDPTEHPTAAVVEELGAGAWRALAPHLTAVPP